MKYKDYYKILEVSREATADEIKKSYRRLARKYHPDVSKEKNSEELFKQVQEAYEVLKDSEKRAAYDQLGSDWQQGQSFRPPPGWNFNQGAHQGASDFSSAFGGGGADFSDFFSSLFGAAGFEGAQAQGGRGRANPFAHQQRAQPQDQKMLLSISLQEAFEGGQKTIQYRTPSGMQALKIKIPKGMLPEQELRLSGKGEHGGDLFLIIDIQPHEFFRLEKQDIYLDLPVTPWEAALGATIAVPTLAGKVDLKIPAGMKSGQKLRLKNRGMPGKIQGDQYVIIQIVLPPLQENDKTFYEKWASESHFNPRQF